MKKVTTDYCDPDETLSSTKVCLSDITRVIVKFIEVKFRTSPGNISYSTFPSGLTELCNILPGVRKPKSFQPGNCFTGQIFTGNSPEWIRPGHRDTVLKTNIFFINNLYINNQFCGEHLISNIWYSHFHTIFNDFRIKYVCVFLGRFFWSVHVINFVLLRYGFKEKPLWILMHYKHTHNCFKLP